LNETLNPYVDCPKLGSYQIKVYNRWGEELFVSADLGVSWDGTYNDLMCPNGVYFWVANWTGVENGLKANKVAKGVITLLR
jgi:gliding motility-associated-like protein